MTRRGGRQGAAALIGATLSIAACTPSNDVAAPPAEADLGATTTSRETSPPDPQPTTSTASDPEPIAEFRPIGRDMGDDELAGELTIRRCRWTWFDRYELEVEWRPDDGVSGVELAASFVVIVGDVGASGFVGTLALPTAGTHDVIVTTDTPPQQDDEAITARLPFDGSTCVVAQQEASTEPYGWNAPLQIDPQPPRDAPARSVQAVLARAEASEALHLAGVIHALERRGDLPIDRVYLDPGGVVEFTEFDDHDGCTMLSTWYRIDDASVSVVQRRGCVDEIGFGGDRILRIVDPTWDVFVIGQGDSVDAVAQRLTGYAVAGSDPVLGDSVPSLEEYLAGWLAERPGFRVGAVFEWNGGDVVIVENTQSPSFSNYEEAIVLLPPGRTFNGGGSTLPCAEYTVSSHDDGLEGFRFFVAEDPSTVFTTLLADGSDHVAELRQGENGDWFSFLDLALVQRDEIDAGGQIAAMFAETVITTADGAPAPCTQN